MITFLKKFLFEGFVPGDFTGGTIHTISLVLLIASCIVFPAFLIGKGEKKVHRWMKGIALSMLVVYFARRGIDIIRGANWIERLWPFYLCNVNTVFIGLCVLFDWKRGREFLFVTGLIGGLFTFAIPQGIYSDRFLTLAVLDSIYSHYGIIVIPVVYFATGTMNLRFSNIWKVFAGMLLALFNVEVLQRLLLTEYHDYLFLHSDLPFTIPGVPQFFILAGLCFILFPFIYMLWQIYEKTVLRSLLGKSQSNLLEQETA